MLNKKNAPGEPVHFRVHGGCAALMGQICLPYVPGREFFQ